jgi:metal-responsive CopG/Arc/MetJ family transcriptional regulator
MRTIAVSIDIPTLARLDRLAAREERTSRSHIVREALREYITRVEQQVDEAREADIVHRHRAALARQAKALVREQARP